MALRAKVAVVGPLGSGKSTLANVLADAVTDGRGQPYRATRGCRILEFEQEGSGRQEMTVELWDVSGSTSGESGWPAITAGLQGIMVVYDINQANPESELDVWFRRFIKKAGLRSGQCLVVANNPREDAAANTQVTLEGPLGKAQLVVVDLRKDTEPLRKAFAGLMENVRNAILQQREAAESHVLKR